MPTLLLRVAKRILFGVPADGEHEYFPLSVVASDPEATLKVHRYLLGSVKTGGAVTEITVRSEKFGKKTEQTYEVGVIDITVAPLTPRQGAGTTQLEGR